MNQSIEKFLQEKVLDQYKPIVKKFRNLVKNEFPILKEEMRGGTEKYYGIPVYRYKKIIISMSPTNKGITFSFTEGKKFKDKYSLLEGKGNKSLNLRIKSVEDYKDEILSYYIKQAVKLDS